MQFRETVLDISVTLISLPLLLPSESENYLKWSVRCFPALLTGYLFSRAFIAMHKVLRQPVQTAITRKNVQNLLLTGSCHSQSALCKRVFHS